MGLLTPNDFESLQALYTAQLRYLLSTEKQIVKGLSEMIEHASDAQLKQAFESHLQETHVHVSRIEQLIADVNDNNVDDKKDPVIAAIVGSGGKHHKGVRRGRSARCGPHCDCPKGGTLRNRLLWQCA